ncbi:MAG: DEAD/DEAH box helicase [Chloroflexi bacterium]|nr:DEAD/DEAH box helicase [Chloroflexota bacterium]
MGLALLQPTTRWRSNFLLTLNNKTAAPATAVRPTTTLPDAAAPRRATPGAPSPFAALGISGPLVNALAKGGITEPTPVQSMTIPDALNNLDVCGKARTGSGKTLAFGLPIIERMTKSQPKRPQALVLVPTRELASQVARSLGLVATVRGVRITAVYGGMSLNRQSDVLRAGIDIVIATPGRLNDLLQRAALDLTAIKTVVIDEADQMADLGFLPQVEQILRRIQHEHQTLLFSATLDGAVDALVRRYQKDPVFHEAVTPEEEEPTMLHRFIGVSEEEKVGVAADIASGPNRTLLFVRTQRGAERLVKQLAVKGLEAGALHGGMSQPKRERALAAFSRGTMPVLVATNIAARGIHVDGVDIVVHHDPPEDTKTYLHRSGRTARAGASGIVVTLVAPEQMRDVNILRREAKVSEAVVPMSAGDARLGDLAGWTPPTEDLSAMREPRLAPGPRPGMNNARRHVPTGNNGQPPRRFGPGNANRLAGNGERGPASERAPRVERGAAVYASSPADRSERGEQRRAPRHAAWGRRSD